MKNNKGFTLIEVLAVIIIIAIVGGISIPNVIKTIENSQNKTEEQMIDNIKTAAEALYTEIEFNDSIIFESIKEYENAASEQIKIDNNKAIIVSLQTLVTYGYLKGTGNPDNEDNYVTNIINPKTKKNIGNCKIKITKTVNNYKVTYTIENASVENKECPTFN